MLFPRIVPRVFNFKTGKTIWAIMYEIKTMKFTLTVVPKFKQRVEDLFYKYANYKKFLIL